jgi:hypothetical protein
MLSRITLVLLTTFWLCMSFLLWRSEFGWRNHLGARIPVSVVWQKILTAPDKSSLDIYHHGKKIGRCQWLPNIGQDAAVGKILSDGIPLDGAPENPASYKIEFGGRFMVPSSPSGLRFTINLTFDTNRVWRDFNSMFNLQPDKWYVSSKASEKTAHVRMEGEDESSDRVYKFSDLQNPRFLVQQFELPISLPLFDALGLSVTGMPAGSDVGLTWEARDDWVTLGHTQVRVYRLQAHLFDRFRIIVLVNQVGEILRVELPDELIFEVGDPFTSL